MTTPLRVLILEDRPADAELMLHELRRAGFEPDWQRAETEVEYRAALDPTLDVILADYNLPQFDATRALKLVQERGLDIPFVIVTGSISEEVAVDAMKSGATDYLLKDRLSRLGPAVVTALEQRRLREEKRRAEKEIEQKNEDLLLVSRLNDAVNRGDDLRAIIRLLAAETKRLYSCYGATVYLCDEDRRYLVMQNLNIPPTAVDWIERLIGSTMPPARIPLKEAGLYRQVLREGKPRLVNDPETIYALTAEFTENEFLRKFVPQICAFLDIHSVINIPLISDGQAIGLIDVSRRELFTESDLRRLETVAGQLTAIIERKQAEDALRASEDRYRDLVENSQELICTHDLEGRILSVNLWASKVLGYTADSLLRMNIRDILAPQVRAGFDAYLATIRREGAASGAMLVRTKAGEERVWEYNNTLRTEGVAAPMVRGMAHDITERKRAEERLRTSEEKFRALVETTGDWVWEIDATGKYTYASPRISELLGYEPEQMLGKSPFDLMPDDEAQRVAAIFSPIVDHGAPFSALENVNQHKDGRLIILESNGVPFFGPDGTLRGYRGIDRDITERKRAALRQEILYQVLRAVSSQLDLNLVAQSAVETLVRLTDYPHVCLALPDEKGIHWVVCGAAGRLAAELGATYPIHSGVIGRAFKTEQMQWVRDVLDDPSYVRDVSAADAPALRSEIVALMRHGDHLLGALNVESERVDAFDDDDAAMIRSLADMI
ncbi:MAG: PAS domain S-box protein, partial [Chloroflexi bacterium]|nr:PAS domain S-box protein [Chloroflexota bacterium]